MKKRKDATLCKDVSQYMRFFPYLWKRRCDCLVFYEIEYDVTALTAFVKEYNRERRLKIEKGEPVSKYPLRFTTAVLISFARILALRPKINRFIANREYWQRNDISMTFVVKKAMNEDAPETSEQLVFNKYATFEEDLDLIEAYIEKCQSVDAADINKSDKMIGTLFKFVPKFILSAFVRLVGFIDQKRGFGRWLGDTDCLHSSVFVANLSSLGISSTAPHHHLYEWGTTSMFSILGPVVRQSVEQNDTSKPREHKDTMKISFTVDERICDGFYLVKSLELVGDFFKNPEMMFRIPEKPVEEPSKKRRK